MKQILFLQGGGGQEDYDADEKLVASLKAALGEDYMVHYPFLSDDESAPDFGRLQQIDEELSSLQGDVIVVAHSLGASMLLKYLSERRASKRILGIFLIATPFWDGNEEWKQGLKLRPDFAERISKDIRIFFYHSMDDDVVPFGHLRNYERGLPNAAVRTIPTGGHQMNNDLSVVAGDIKSL